MKRAGIIGLGVISRYYLRGLKDSKALNLIAVCDQNTNSYNSKAYKEYKFYSDYLDMIKNERLE